MAVYPLHPCCYCDKREAGLVCCMTRKVECNRFLAYIQKLNNMNAQQVLIKELRYLITDKGGK